MEESVGQRIKILRKALNLTQGELAEAINMAQPSLAKVEKGGGLEMDRIIKIALNYNINLNWLLLGKGEMIEKPQDEVIEKLREELADAKDLIIALYREKDDLQKEVNKFKKAG